MSGRGCGGPGAPARSRRSLSAASRMPGRSTDTAKRPRARARGNPLDHKGSGKAVPSPLHGPHPVQVPQTSLRAPFERGEGGMGQKGQLSTLPDYRTQGIPGTTSQTRRPKGAKSAFRSHTQCSATEGSQQRRSPSGSVCTLVGGGLAPTILPRPTQPGPVGSAGRLVGEDAAPHAAVDDEVGVWDGHTRLRLRSSLK